MKRIDKYIIRGLLGRGGMGKVFKVEIPVISKIAALKYLDPNPFLIDLIGIDKIRDLFIAEAVTMARLKHPAIVDIWDFGETGGRPYYLFDLYSHNLGTVIGETYRTEMPSRPLPVEKAIEYTRQILSGLDCMHSVGIIHRDIKPFNILLTDQDSVKICDFGLSKLRGEVFEGPPGLKIGTPWYAAPEQENAPERADERADLYSVGVMLYRMTTGGLPTENRSDLRKWIAGPDMSWEFFFGRALDPTPAKRFQSAVEMNRALASLQEKWVLRKEKACRLSEGESSGTDPSISHRYPAFRRNPIKVRQRQAGVIFELDELWRPKHYIRNDFHSDAPGCIIDRNTGLLWQQKGSTHPMTWTQAREYIERLNRTHWAGYDTWRLPTMAELTTLLTAAPQSDNLCIEPIFDPEQKWLWSCDRQSFISAWYVSLEMGYVSWNDFSAYYHVKGVCDETFSTATKK